MCKMQSRREQKREEKRIRRIRGGELKNGDKRNWKERKKSTFRQRRKNENQGLLEKEK